MISTTTIAVECDICDKKADFTSDVLVELSLWAAFFPGWQVIVGAGRYGRVWCPECSAKILKIHEKAGADEEGSPEEGEGQKVKEAGDSG